MEGGGGGRDGGMEGGGGGREGEEGGGGGREGGVIPLTAVQDCLAR